MIETRPRISNKIIDIRWNETISISDGPGQIELVQVEIMVECQEFENVWTRHVSTFGAGGRREKGKTP